MKTRAYSIVAAAAGISGYGLFRFSAFYYLLNTADFWKMVVIAGIMFYVMYGILIEFYARYNAKKAENNASVRYEKCVRAKIRAKEEARKKADEDTYVELKQMIREGELMKEGRCHD